MQIVINRSDAIGDVLLTLPCPSALKKKYPKCSIAFIIHPKCSDLFKDNCNIDETWILDPQKNCISTFFYLLKKFKSFKTTHYFFIGGSHRPSYVAKILNVKFRGGLLSKISTFICLNRGTRQKRSLVEMHESEYNLNLLQSLDLTPSDLALSEHYPKIATTSSSIEENYQNFLHQLKSNNFPNNRELFFIHPGMSNHTLSWASRNYGRLMVKLAELYQDRFLFIVSYTSADQEYLTNLKNEISKTTDIESQIYFFNGEERGLHNYISILSKAQIFVGGSTGPTHIANALGIKQVALYSPIKVQSALRWGPCANNPALVKIIVPDVVCGEQFSCAKKNCPYFECMAKIEVSKVIKKIEELLDT